MSQRDGRAVSAATRGWVRLYSLGLPQAARADRRDEISSDLWEHVADCEATGRAPGLEILTRWLLGMPSDLLWRLERSRLARSPGAVAGLLFAVLASAETAARWAGRRGLSGFAGVWAALVALLGAFVAVTAPSRDAVEETTAELVAIGLVLLATAAAVGVGSRLLDERPRLGGMLVMLGAAPVGLLLWQTIVAPVAAAALCWGVVARWRRAGDSDVTPSI